MLELPRHHVPRDDLLAPLAAASVVVIEAPSGFGKSTLAAELVRGQRAVEVALTEQETGRHALLLPLRRALRRAGELDAASALGELGVGPADALDAMADAVHGTTPLTLAIDDAHHLGAEGSLLVGLVARRPATVRIVIGARALPPSAAKLRGMPGVEHVTTADLRFDEATTGSLLREGFGLEVTPDVVSALTEQTGGWPAALAFAGGQLQRSGDQTAVAGTPEGFATLVLGALPGSIREAAAQLAHLPWLDARLADAASGSTGTLDAMVAAGLPFALDSDGTYRLPGAVTDALSRAVAFDVEVARRAAAHLLDRGQPFDAIGVLRRARAWDHLADLLVDLPARARVRLSADELISAIDALPEHVVAAHPTLLLELARALSRAGVPAQQHDALDRAVRLADGQPPTFQRAIEVQRLGDAIYVDDRAEVVRQVEALLELAGPGEDAVVARGLVLRGMLCAWEQRLEEARRSLRRAAELFVAVGEPYEASRALVQLGFTVELHGDLRVAEETFAEAVELAGNDGRARATALTYLGEVKVWLGRSDEGVRDLQASLHLARAVRDLRAQGYAAWGLALDASVRGDVERTVALVREAERLLSTWSDTGIGATFVATMVDHLDRAGAIVEADAMLARARARRAEQPELVSLAEFLVAARRGDPAEAERLWPTIEADDGIELFERTRCRYLRAYAALRREDPATERLYREAIAEADALGIPQVPAHLEPSAALAFSRWRQSSGGAWLVRCLGALEVQHAGESVALPPGRPTLLVGLLAAGGRPQRVPWIIDVLWPGVAETDGRARLRQVLYRLRNAAPGLVERTEPDQLCLGEEVASDLATFEELAAAALPGPAFATTAGDAVRLVRGPVLDGMTLDDGSGWLELVRDRVRGRTVALLEGLAAEAERDGDREAAVAWAQRAHGYEPETEVHALRLARLLAGVGRTADARAALSRTLTVLEELELPPSSRLLVAHRRLAGGQT